MVLSQLPRFAYIHGYMVLKYTGRVSSSQSHLVAPHLLSGFVLLHLCAHCFVHGLVLKQLVALLHSHLFPVRNDLSRHLVHHVSVRRHSHSCTPIRWICFSIFLDTTLGLRLISSSSLSTLLCILPSRALRSSYLPPNDLLPPIVVVASGSIRPQASVPTSTLLFHQLPHLRPPHPMPWRRLTYYPSVCGLVLWLFNPFAFLVVLISVSPEPGTPLHHTLDAVRHVSHLEPQRYPSHHYISQLFALWRCGARTR
jgi:hypothetical protein